jgi:hypothetical protein
MSVRVEDDAIILAGRCGAEDAEALLVALRDGPGRAVDLSAVQKLHLAPLQVLIVARPTLRAPPPDPVLARQVLSALQ